MLKEERQERILEYINKNGKASVEELLIKYKVSKPTILRDLGQLERKSLIYRAHGGALSLSNLLSNELPYSEKKLMNTKEKKVIGEMAAQFVDDGDVIIIDAGSTTLEFAKQLSNKRIKVITNDIRIGLEFSNYRNADLLIPPGKLVKSLYTLKGMDTAEYFKNILVDKVFLGADAIDLNSGLYNFEEDESYLKRCMIRASNQVFVLADKKKFDIKTFSKVCEIEDVNYFITDYVSKDKIEFLENKGIKVVSKNQPR